MKILIHRPDKKDNPNVDKECLYYPSGYKYKEPDRRKDWYLTTDEIVKYNVGEVINSFTDFYKPDTVIIKEEKE